jgi:hypothetical protein
LWLDRRCAGVERCRHVVLLARNVVTSLSSQR